MFTSYMGYRNLFIATCLAGVGLSGCGPELEPGLEGEAPVTGTQALTEGAPLTTYDASCLQLQDQNTWSTYASYMTPVGPALGLSSILQDLNRVGPMLTATTHPTAVGYKGGFRWNDGDMGTTEWIPQGLTAGVSGSANVVIASWHFAPTTPDKGVRISVADISDMSLSAVNYRHILLVRPTSSGNFTVVPEHGGGLTWFGNYLYMADTSDGMRVFDLTQIRQVDTSTTCETAIGKVGSVWCAYGYKYVLPQVSAYVQPSTITTPCRAKFSFLGKDTRGTTPVVLSGEYCNNDDTPCTYGGTSSAGLGGRLYRWPVDSTTNRLKTVSGVVKPEHAYIMNEPNVQGVAPIMTTTSTTSYWLSSTRYSGSLFKVSTTASRTAFLSGSSQWARMPEGMHATGTGTNLWTVTEGYNGTTNPATGGRVVFYADQASLD